MASGVLPVLYIPRRDWQPEPGKPMDYTRFEIMGIPSSKTIQIRIEAAHTSPMRRQRTTYHSPLLSVEECGELIKKLKSAVNAARGRALPVAARGSTCARAASGSVFGS